jgi:hypothetical protein
MLVDTGSTVSIVKYETWKRIKRPGMDLRRSPVQLSGVDGGTFKSYGRRDIPITIGDVVVMQNVEVGDCQDDVILGMDFLKAHSTGIDFGRPSLMIGDEEVELTFYQPEPGKARVEATHDVVVATVTERTTSYDGSDELSE